MTDSLVQKITSIGIVVTLILYVLPWISVPDSPLILNAFDLAEWTSLHPASRSAQLPLLSSLLLRLPLTLFGVLIAAQAYRRFSIGWTLSVIIVMLLVIAQLPPIDQLTNLNDGNYRQQLLLAFITLISASAILVRKQPALPAIITGVLWLLLAASSIAALLRAIQLMQMFELSPQIGFGAVLFPLTSIIIAGLLFVAARNK